MIPRASRATNKKRLTQLGDDFGSAQNRRRIAHVGQFSASGGNDGGADKAVILLSETGDVENRLPRTRLSNLCEGVPPISRWIHR